VTVRKGTRLDLCLEEPGRRRCYVEIKNCTLVEDGTAMFPDAVTVRGQKHLDELKDLVKTGHRAVIFFLIQRMDAQRFAPAAGIDPARIRVHRSLPVRL
jgi:sugar fermentation stimulation protein A